MAQTIAEEVRVKLTPENQARFAQAEEVNPELIDFYFKGRHFWEKRDAKSMESALDYYQRALAFDSTFALAYSGIAEVYTVMGDHGYLPTNVAFPKAKEAVQKAIRFNNTLAEAYNVLAYLYFIYDWDWNNSEKEFKHAINLNPNYSKAYHWYAFLLSGLGRNDEALEQIARARALDPLSKQIIANTGYLLYFSRKYDKAISVLKDAIELFPEHIDINLYLARIYMKKEMYLEAIEIYKQVDHPIILSNLACAYTRVDSINKSLEILEHLKQESSDTFIPSSSFAELYFYLNDMDSFYQWLEKASDERDSNFIWLLRDPILDPVRQEARFISLRRKMELPME